MEKKLPIIQSLWVGDKLSNLEKLCLQSYVYHGHSFHLYTYDILENLPSGVTLRDANEVLPESSIFKYKDRNTFSGFSNLFRYKLLLDKGGYWSDMDMVCLQPLDFASDYVFATEGDHEITNCLIRAPSQSELMRECYSGARQFDSDTITWGKAGPIFFKNIVAAQGLSNFASDPSAFCAIHYSDFQVFTQPRSAELLETNLKNVYGLHLWNEMWRIKNLDKNRIFTPTSLYRTLQLRFG